MDEHSREEFLNRTVRLGNLSTLRRDGSPSTVPVWFDWDGTTVNIFADSQSSKLTRIANDPRVALLVVNNVGEQEAWVSFDGVAIVNPTGGFELAERLAERYWDLTDPEKAETLESWRAAADGFSRISFVPSRIRSYA